MFNWVENTTLVGEENILYEGNIGVAFKISFKELCKKIRIKIFSCFWSVDKRIKRDLSKSCKRNVLSYSLNNCSCRGLA